MLRRLGLLWVAGAAACTAPGLERFEYVERHMGTDFRIVLFAADEAQAQVAAGAAFARIGELDRALSDYDPESELSRLGARSDGGTPSATVEVSADLFSVLAAAQEIARASRGAFDVTVGPYVRLWRRAGRQEARPKPEQLATAARSVGFEKLALGPGREVRLLAPGMRLDVGGIAKGLALDEARAELAARGLEQALLVGGGELLAGEPPPGERGWRIALVGLESAEEELVLARVALATSGDLERYVELEGRRYSHILDPRTGEALSERRLASVLAATAMEADALATAVSVLGPEAGLALASTRPRVEARVLVRRDGRTECFRSPGFPAGVILPRTASPGVRP